MQNVFLINIIIAGFIFGEPGLVKVGIVLFGIVIPFQLITLPVEFNASSRAKALLYFPTRAGLPGGRDD